MCGIVACRTVLPAVDHLLPALRRLEYRGYDSAGIAVRTHRGNTHRVRSVGRIDVLEKRLAACPETALSEVGVGHTRWATHGAVTESNAHPHADCTGRISLVHNGILTNVDLLRTELEAAGHRFASEVDSEILAHLVEDRLSESGDLHAAVLAAVCKVRGSWAIAVLDGATGRLVVGANRSPLVVARSAHGDFAASDVGAIAEWIDELRVLRDGDVVELGTEHTWSGPEGRRVPPEVVACAWRTSTVELGAHPDHMAKEIAEQPEVAARLLDELAPGVADGRLWAGLGLPLLQRVHVLGCGTSLNAGRVIAGVLRMGGVPVVTSVASESTARVSESGTLTIAMSQSGETADVLRAVELAASDPAFTLLSLTNNPHSTLARVADATLLCAAGPEIGVAATKTFTTQVLAGTMLALSGLVASGRLGRVAALALVAELRGVPERLAAASATANQLVPDLVAEVVGATGFLYLARGPGLPYAAEGALKLAELTYRWAQAYPSGELKHGPLALVEQGTPVVVVDDGDPRVALGIAEVRARGARVITIGGPGSTVPVTIPHDEPPPPWGPVETVVPLQVLARTLGLALGRDVDKPRNLAKSVTVE